MTGVFGLKKGLLKGDILINLDSEDEGELYVGCAGGIDVSATRKVTGRKITRGMVHIKSLPKGLREVIQVSILHLARANSNKIMFRFLMQAESDFGIRLAEAAGGDLRNAIPRESYSVVLVSGAKAKEFEKFVKGYDKMYKQSLPKQNLIISFTCKKTDLPAKGYEQRADQFQIIRAVFVCPNGVQRMSQSVKGSG